MSGGDRSASADGGLGRNWNQPARNLGVGVSGCYLALLPVVAIWRMPFSGITLEAFTPDLHLSERPGLFALACDLGVP